MRIALAKKLKAQRKTKRMTIAQILGVKQKEETKQQNPNEPNEEVLSDHVSIDSQIFGDLSSMSEDEQIVESPNRSSQAKTPAQLLLAKHQGLEITEGEDLFHLLYNPHYTQWRQKRS